MNPKASPFLLIHQILQAVEEIKEQKPLTLALSSLDIDDKSTEESRFVYSTWSVDSYGKSKYI